MTSPMSLLLRVGEVIKVAKGFSVAMYTDQIIKCIKMQKCDTSTTNKFGRQVEQIHPDVIVMFTDVTFFAFLSN